MKPTTLASFLTPLVLLGPGLAETSAEDAGAASPLEPWRGEWSGTCRFQRPGQPGEEFTMTLAVSPIAVPPIERSAQWNWRIEYASPDGRHDSIRAYSIRPEGSDPDHFVIDEKNGIEIDCFRVGDALWSEFEVSGVRLSSRFARAGDFVEVEIVTWKVAAGRETSPDGDDSVVRSFRMHSFQRGTLARVEEE